LLGGEVISLNLHFDIHAGFAILPFKRYANIKNALSEPFGFEGCSVFVVSLGSVRSCIYSLEPRVSVRSYPHNAKEADLEIMFEAFHNSRAPLLNALSS
jgi:hypothetical protein